MREIVIKLEEETYNRIMNGWMPLYKAANLMENVQNGTPLPKGHGDLVDRKDLIKNGISKGFCDWYDEIKMADTIIEADKENE